MWGIGDFGTLIGDVGNNGNLCQILLKLTGERARLHYDLFASSNDEGRWLLVNSFKKMPQILIRVKHFFAPLRGLTDSCP